MSEGDDTSSEQESTIPQQMDDPPFDRIATVAGDGLRAILRVRQAAYDINYDVIYIRDELEYKLGETALDELLRALAIGESTSQSVNAKLDLGSHRATTRVTDTAIIIYIPASESEGAVLSFDAEYYDHVPAAVKILIDHFETDTPDALSPPPEITEDRV